MKRIAIITITNSGMNCGNRLQNYALQKVLEKYSICVQTIYSAKSVKNSIFLSRMRRLFKAIFKVSKRRNYFNAFDKEYIKKAKRMRYEFVNDHRFNEDFDAFIAGSDQIWNPSFEFNSDFEFMTFADPDKRYSYSASFGVSEIPEEYRQVFAERLGQLRTISVREKQGQEIVKQLTNLEAKVHIDPTMLLKAECYVEIEKKPDYPIPDKYLLMYFLGEKSDEYIEFIKQVAEKQNLTILELSELPGTPLYHIGPQHFLYLFRHAEYICTDSFHGTIYAMLFHKQFTVYYRCDGNVPMNSRIDTLLEKMALGNRIFGELSVQDSINEIPYHEVDALLEKEREIANKYLREIIAQW